MLVEMPAQHTWPNTETLPQTDSLTTNFVSVEPDLPMIVGYETITLPLVEEIRKEMLLNDISFNQTADTQVAFYAARQVANYSELLPIYQNLNNLEMQAAFKAGIFLPVARELGFETVQLDGDNAVISYREKYTDRKLMIDFNKLTAGLRNTDYGSFLLSGGFENEIDEIFDIREKLIQAHTPDSLSWWASDELPTVIIDENKTIEYKRPLTHKIKDFIRRFRKKI